MNITTEVLIAVAIVASIALQFGAHRLDWRRVVLPLGIVIGFAFYYLKGVPTTGNDALFVLAGTALGLVLGGAAAALMGVGRDESGRVMLTAGIAYIALWVVVFGARLAFVLIAQNSPSTFRDLFVWAYRNGITQEGWTDFFLLQALAMVGVRTVVTAIRALVARRSSSLEVRGVAVR